MPIRQSTTFSYISRESADHLGEEKETIEATDQNWVVLFRQDQLPIVLMREPRNETEVNALIWKLEAVNALPFFKFQTLAYIGAKRGPDLLVNFQEDRDSEPQRSMVVEVENHFYGYTAHGHISSQYPRVICWDIAPKGRKGRFTQVPNKPYKQTHVMDEYQVHVYVIKQMEGIRVISKAEFGTYGIRL